MLYSEKGTFIVKTSVLGGLTKPLTCAFGAFQALAALC